MLTCPEECKYNFFFFLQTDIATHCNVEKRSVISVVNSEDDFCLGC